MHRSFAACFAARLFAPAMLCVAVVPPLRAETLARWSFDEPVDSSRGASLRDASGNGLDLELGEGRIVADGKFGHGLLCPTGVVDFVARRLDVGNSPLNLGNEDWTIEWWQKRLAPVAEGHVDWMFLLRDNAIDPGETDWQKGFQTEARFAGPGLWSHDQAISALNKRVFWPVLADKFDEITRLAFSQDVNPAFYAAEDSGFHHLAWVYDAQRKRLMYFEDGRGPFYIRDGASVTPGNQTNCFYGMIAHGEIKSYPDRYSAFNQGGNIGLYVGGVNVQGPGAEQVLGIAKIPEGYRFTSRPRAETMDGSVIDEMRLSRGVLYRQPFTPPAPEGGGEGPAWPVLSPRRLEFVAIAGRAPAPQMFSVILSGDETLDWRVSCAEKWAKLSIGEGSLKGPAGSAMEVPVEVDPSLLWPGWHTARIEFNSNSAGAPPLSIEVRLKLQSEDHATWLFDEPLDAPARFQLEDQSVNGFDLILGSGGRLLPGRTGHALDPRAGRGRAALLRFIDPTHLNLGNFDWTWEAWLRSDEPARAGDVLFMMRQDLLVGPYPRLTGRGAACGLVIGPDARSLRLINEASATESLDLATDPAAFDGRNGQWHHVFIGYDSAARRLAHWLDGKQRAVITLDHPLLSLPATGENNLSVGKTVEGDFPFRGLIDEMRIAARRSPAGDFTPESLAPPRNPIQLAAGPQLFFDDYLIEESEGLLRVAQQPEYPVSEPEGWDAFDRERLPPSIVDAGDRADDPARRFRRYRYAHTHSEPEGVGGIHLDFAPAADGPWTTHTLNPIIPYTWCGLPGSTYSVSDISSYFYDDATGLYGMLFKCNPQSGENPELAWYRDERWNYQNRVLSGFRRYVGLATSPDGIHWSNIQRIFVPDDRDEGETQWLVANMIKRGSLYLIHAMNLRDDVERSIVWTTLSTSRDLYHWTRWREPFIDTARDPAGGERFIGVGDSRELFIIDDMMYFSYSVGGSHKPPRASFPAFARMPLDRFVARTTIGGEAGPAAGRGKDGEDGAGGGKGEGERTSDGEGKRLRGESGEGRLLTPPLLLDASLQSLAVNAAIAPEGELRVQLRDADGDVLRGYSFEDCEPIRGDEVRHPVAWRGGRDLAKIAAKDRSIRIELRLRNAAVYAFYLE